MKVDYTPKYDYKELHQKLLNFLNKQKLEIIDDNFSIDNNDYYCRIHCKLFKRTIEISLTPLGEDNVGLGLSYWQCENQIVEHNSPVISYTILKLSIEDKLFENAILKFYKIFRKMLKIHLKHYKELKCLS